MGSGSSTSSGTTQVLVNKCEKETITYGLKNPLFNQVVLAQVFKHLPRNALLACRLVCVLWKEESTYEIQRRNYLIDFTVEEKIIEFLKFIEKCKRPFNFPLINVCLEINFEMNSKSSCNLTKFLQAISPWVVVLYLIFKSSHGHSTIRLTKKWNFPKLSNLFLADLNVPHIYDEVSGLYIYPASAHAAPKFNIVRQIVRNAKVLTHFSYYGESANDSQEFISCLKFSSMLTNISHLALGFPLNDNALQELMRLGLRLKSLEILYATVSQFTYELPKLFLESQKNTLQYLKMSVVWSFYFERFEFPRMTKLSALTIQRMFDSENNNLSFMPIRQHTFPKLCNITLKTNSSTHKWEDIFENSQSSICPSVTKLELTFDHVSNDIIYRVVYLFPNLKKIEIPAKEDVVQLVFMTLPNLEELGLKEVSWNAVNQNTTLIDSLILGKTQSQCEKIRKRCRGNWQKMRENLSETESPGKSITCLKQLKCLKLFGKEETTWGISELVCAQLLEMNSLQLVQFSCSILVSREMMDEMRRRFLVLWQ